MPESAIEITRETFWDMDRWATVMNHLSTQDKEIMKALFNGHNGQDIAKQLNLSCQRIHQKIYKIRNKITTLYNEPKIHTKQDAFLKLKQEWGGL